MKKIFTISAFFFSVSLVTAQGLWVQKETFPFVSSARVSFSINSKGYVYTGQPLNNFFMYDPVANTWTAKADFPGGGRTGAAGFATDSFGFVGGGQGASFFNDFYKYDPAANSWTTRAGYPDSIQGAFSFCINNVGYIAGGNNAQRVTAKCYAYDVSANQWIQKDSLPIAMREGFSAVVNGKGYCGLGRQIINSHIDSVYEYDPVADNWQSRAGHRIANSSYNPSVFSFAINNLIYVSDPETSIYGKVAIFNPALNSWSEISTYPYSRYSSCTRATDFVGLTIGNRGFLGGQVRCTYNSFWEFDPANHFTITAFTPDTLCDRDSMQVTFTSSLTFNPGNHFKLKLNATGLNYFSDQSDSVPGTAAGTYTFRIPRMNYSSITSRVDVDLLSTDPPRQTAHLINQQALIKDAPIETKWAASYTRCAGTAILLYRSPDLDMESYWSYWGNTDTSSFTFNFRALEPTQDAMVYVTDIDIRTGCSATDSTLIKFYDRPPLQITDSMFTICPGTSVALGGTATANVRYEWSSGGFLSTAVNPVVNPASNSTYAVMLTDTISGCIASGNTEVNIAEPPLQSICFVTVDSNSTHNILIWEKTDRSATDSFIIYREISTNNYQPIGAVHGDSLSEFHDYAANPNATAYRYKIAAVDTCSTQAAVSVYHHTIHLQYLGNGNMLWNVYEIENTPITPINSFDVFCDSLGNGNWYIMMNVPGNQHSATDINFNQHPNARYRIGANWAYTCTAQRSGSSTVLSNIMTITSTGINSAFAEAGVNLFPNPAINELIIQSGSNTIEQVRILSINGSVIKLMKPLNNRMDISLLPAGVYIAEIKTKEITVMKRWVKM